MKFQERQKRTDGRCFLCGETDYTVLDCHRIIEGGEYKRGNVATMCANCHRRNHRGNITVTGRRLSTSGWVILYKEDGEEKVLPV